MTSTLRTVQRLLVIAFVAAGVGCAASAPAPGGGGPSPSADVPVPAPSDDVGVAVSSASEAETRYLLGEGDQISIQVFDEPDLSINARIGGSGTINYSYLGDLKVAGKSAQQLERTITELLSDGYLVNPSVNVTITEYRPFFINGEVRSPGGYPYQPGLTLGKAVALAGGLTDRASTRKMYRSRVADGGGVEQVRISMDTPITPGDIISIEEGFF